MHDFYSQSGPAINKGYGRSRREISNLQHVSSHLGKIGVDFGVFEPGVHSLACQTSVFGRAERIFGIRGAEWANLIWVKPTTEIFVVFNEGLETPFVPRLANDLGVRAYFLTDPEKDPIVNPSAVRDFFMGTV